MSLISPSWVTHNGYPIFSTDIHPDGTRFATGGGDNRIKIWSVKAVESQQEEDNPNTPKLLCSMENHYGPVNCVRWSPDGKYLASGSDDKLIIIWQLMPGLSSKVFGQDVEIHEHWRAVSTLKGHVSDIVDLAWSPDGVKLVSCSLDNKVIVWDILRFELLKFLEGHSGWVKGVAWDPTGKFIASHSEDHSLIIWRTVDWTIEKRITDIFKNYKGNSFFLRLSWSADGSYLTCGQGTSNGHRCAYALSRSDNFKNSCDFVGHRESIVCTRWNPRIFRQSNHNNGNPYSLCCIGSSDRSLSIWSTGGALPILVLKELFSQGVLDLSWSRDGNKLLVSSHSGEVALVIFKENQLGTPLPESDVHDLIRKNYGDTMSRSNTALPENPLQVQLEKNAALVAPQQPAKPTTVTTMPPPQGINILQPRVKSTLNQPPVVSTTPDGRKRITPTLVSQIPAPVPSTTATTTTTTTTTTTASTSVATFSSIASIISPPSPPSTTPTVTSTTSATPAATEGSGTTASTSMEIESGGIEAGETSTPSTVVVTVPGKETESNKRKETDKEGATVAKKQKLKEKLKEKEKEKTKKKTKEKELKSAREKRRESGSISSRNIKAKLLPLPEVQTKITYMIKQTNNIFSQLPVTIDINYSENNSITTSYINATSGTKAIWEDRIKGQVSLVAGNTKFVAIATSDSSLYIYSMSGRHELPCIVLGDTIHSLTCNKAKHLMAITVTGHVYIWDIPNQQLTISANIEDFIESQGIIKRSLLTEEGLPIITFANLYTYCYHNNMKVWCRVGDDKFGESEYTSVLPPMKSMGLLSQLQSQAIPNIASPTVQSKNIESISHLENQVASSLLLGSASEYKYWMEMYIRKLTHDANELKLREICNMLLGPPMKLSAIGKTWEANILGYSKREMLSGFLKNVISSNRALQRIVNEFTDNLANLAEDQ